MIKKIVKTILPPDIYETLTLRYVNLRDKIALERLKSMDYRKYEAIKKVLPYTMVGHGGLSATYDVVKKAKNEGIKGCMVECGVARGGSALLMGLADKSRKLWLFDTFSGLPAPTKEDTIISSRKGEESDGILKEGYCAGSQSEVSDLMMANGITNARTVKGMLQLSLPLTIRQLGDIAVLRIDVDWYESTKCVLENLYNKVVHGGFIIVDDYALAGCKKAVDEYIKDVEIVKDGRGGMYFRKQ